MALTLLTDKISKALYDGEYVLGVFLKVGKAFDTAKHDILLHKLYAYGIRGTGHDWMKSYLSSCVQYVVYNDVESIKKLYNVRSDPGFHSWAIAIPVIYQ